MSTLAIALVLSLLFLGGAVLHIWRAFPRWTDNPKPEKLRAPNEDSQYLVVRLGGQKHAFTVEAIVEAKKRAERVYP